MRTTPSSDCRNRPWSGFTLVELLVVIAIIAILAALLLPVIGSAREKGRQSACLSNEKQLGLGFAQYEQDYDEQVPCGIEGNWMPVGWAGQIYPYIKSGNIYICPDDTTKSIGAYQPISYVYNGNLDHFLTGPYNGVPAADYLSKMTSPGRTVLLCEGYTYMASPGSRGVDFALQDGTSNAANGVDYSDWFNDLPAGMATGPMADGSTTFYGNGTGTTPRHINGTLFLCLDGHVKFLPPSFVSCGRTATSPTVAASGADAEGTACRGAGCHELTFSDI